MSGVPWGEDLVEHVETKIRFQSGRPEKAFPSPAPRPAEAGTQAWEFQVVLLRSSAEQKLGIQYVKHNASLSGSEEQKVQGLKPDGICDLYNKEMQRYPENSSSFMRQVAPGDIIISVNGQREASKMKAELATSCVVHFHIRRPPS
eukprot:TRINITY_DN27541_c0_g2_i1.p1 TRINITY_DN27541_c0_g2~~TRINITY_DN27541_c0_g2_i1.p1  ORF type:complete len:158 (+),score=31.22 TRINITY_DN27541_c0_g2_i1:38-475(+)